MTINVANLDITTDTFGTWVSKTNTLAHLTTNHVVTVDGTASGNSSTGNGTVNGVFGSTTLFANTALRGGNVSTACTLTISSNLSVTNTAAITGALTLSNTITATGLTTLNGGMNTTTANASSAVNVGANTTVNTSTVKVGNSTVNTVITSTGIDTDGTLAVLNTVSFSNTLTVAGNTAITTRVSIGNSTVNIVANSTTITVGNSSVNGTHIVANTGTFGNIVVSGTVTTTGTVNASGDIIPPTTNTYSLGNSTSTFRTGFFSNVETTNINATNSVAVSTAFTANTTRVVLSSAVGLSVNGSIGTSGQILTSNGTTAYWSSPAALGITSVASGNGLSGGPITSTGTLSILANNGITANSTGVFVISVNGLITNSTGVHVLANTGIVSNSTGTFVNASYISTLSANNTAYFDGQLPAYYTNATNISSGTLSNARLSSAIVNTSGSFTFTGIHTYSANVVLGSSGFSSNGSFGTAGQTLHSNGTATYWAADDQGVTSVASGNGLVSGTITTTGTISLLANSGIVVNATGIFVNANNGIIANDTGVYVNANNGIIANSLGVFIRSSNGTTLDSSGIQVLANSGLTTNATGVYVLANNGLVSNSTGVFVNANTGIVANSTGTFVNASYIATISANNTSFLGGTAAASYQLNSTLAANVATLTANNSTNLNGQAASFYTNATNMSTGTLPADRLSGTYTMNITGTASGNYNAVQNLSTFTNANQGYGIYLSNSYIQSTGQTVQLVRVYTYFSAPPPPPPPGPPSCFPSYALVSMADGSIKTIDQVLVGDKVMGGFGQINTVIAYHKSKLGNYPLYTINNRHETTQEHRHWTTDGWTAIDITGAAPEYVHQIYIDNNGTTEMRKNTKLKYSKVLPLQVGMSLITHNGPEVIESIEADYSADTEQYVYSLICDGSHACLVNDIIVSAWARDDDFDYNTWTPR